MMDGTRKLFDAAWMILLERPRNKVGLTMMLGLQ